jgi:predicted SAM-dependent methyltransferase
MSTRLPYLNIGCGHRYHPEWVNIDMVAQGPGVIEHDLSKGLPFREEQFDVVYHSHVLEHIPRSGVPYFLKECLRVLKTDGILRLAVPDLEQAAKTYLQTIEAVVSDQQSAFHKDRHQWMQIELLDQMVRNQSGGSMKLFLENIRNDHIRQFVIERCGIEVEHIISAASLPGKSFREKLTKFKKLSTKSKFHFVWNTVCYIFIDKIWLWGDAHRAWQTGQFRHSGEVHQWMYDKVSVTSLLEEAGFTDIRICHAFESSIPHWTEFQLDNEGERIYKPESIFVEARKP